MSYAALNAAWSNTIVTDPTCMLILISLADQANDDGYCWPGVNSLARRCRVSERSIQRWLKWMAANGLIEILERPGTSNKYRVMGGDTSVRGVVDVTTGGDTDVTGGVTPMSPKPSLNHQKEPSLSGFDEFWKAYPKKADKKAAERAYRSALKAGATPAILAAAALSYSREKAETEPRFIKNPATWLNAGSWENGHTTDAAPQMAYCLTCGDTYTTGTEHVCG